jgi:hypothetical protein
MTTLTLTPFDLSDAKPLGKRVFRKQILKKGTIKYKGKRVDFDDSLLAELAKNFDEGAYDQVPLVLANEANQHNEDPERFHGELLSVELTPEGLDGIFSLTSKGARIVKDNPRLGVSARIMGGVEHADGREFGRSIRHVLATMNPRLTGMKPWQAAMDLSEEDEDLEVVDLTAATVKEGSLMATKSKTKKAVAKPSDGVVTVTTSKGDRKIDLSALSDEEFQALLDLSASVDDEDEVEDEDLDDEVDEDEDDESDEDDEEDEEEDEDETDLAVPPAFVKNQKKKKGAAPEADADESVKANLTKKKAKKKAEPAFSLSNSVAKRLAEGEWRRERREYAKAGVPPYMLDLAAPILSAPDAVMVDLSDDGEQADAGGVIRKLLDAAKGYIEIKPEVGHQIDLSMEDDSDKPKGDDAFLAAWDSEYGKA